MRAPLAAALSPHSSQPLAAASAQCSPRRPTADRPPRPSRRQLAKLGGKLSGYVQGAHAQVTKEEFKAAAKEVAKEAAKEAVSPKTEETAETDKDK